MKKIMSLLLKSKKSEIKKFKNIKTCKLNAILDNFHNFGANLKIFSSLQLNFMENRYQIQNLKIWWIHENSYLKLRFFRNSTKSYISKYYVGHWAVLSELCFCLELKNTFELQKMLILDPVNCKSKSALCACRPCIIHNKAEFSEMGDSFFIEIKIKNNISYCNNSCNKQ